MEKHVVITLGSTSEILYETDGLVRQSVDDGRPAIWFRINYQLGRTLSVNDVFDLTMLIMIYSKLGITTSKIDRKEGCECRAS
jgi:hypothetical protein